MFLSGNRCRRYHSDIFATRLLGRPAVCIMGAEAAQIFYQPERFTRQGSLPKAVLWLLQDSGSVATLDHAEHPGTFSPLAGKSLYSNSAGGGDHWVNHRCAGEWLTIELMKRSVRLLTTQMHYTVPAQDLSINLRRLPALSNSRFIIVQVRATPAARE